MTDPFSGGAAGAEGAPGAPGDPVGLEELVRSAYQSAAHTVRPEDLRRTSPMLTAGSVPRPRRINMLVPFAAAAAVIVAVGASVALPRLLTGSSGSGSGSPGTSPPPGISTYAPGQHPPYQVVLTVNAESALLVESAATGRVLSSVPQPPHGDTWDAVSATGDATKFILAAAPAWPYTPTRLYTLTLSARGRVAKVAPLATLSDELVSMAASADGSTVAFTTTSGGNYRVGVLSGGKTRQWTVPEYTVLGVSGISVSDNGGTLAFFTDGQPNHGTERAVWVLSTSSATGSLTGAARKIRDYTWIGGQGHAMTIPESALISPDGSKIYISTAATAASGKTVTRVIAYSTSDGASLGTISTWESGQPTALIPVGGLPLIWNPGSFVPYGKSDYTAYLLNPATRKRTTLRLRGIPRARFVVELAW